MQYSFRIPDELVEKLDSYVDGIRFRSRAHLIVWALADWVEQEEKNVKKKEK